MDGPTIKRLRESLGMSQEDLARKTHISLNAIGRYERGDSTPKRLYLKALERVLKPA
jgi:transcriptional regulator with XRE-family HTH domain